MSDLVLKWYFPNGTVANLTDSRFCTYDNGSVVPESIVGRNDSLNCLCNATFKADNDIGGLGVIASFVLTCAVTTLIATVVEWTPPGGFTVVIDEFWAWLEGRELQTRKAHSSRLYRFCLLMLPPLADLQTITGVGIVVAGLVRACSRSDTISYYHLTLVDSYWWLTVNSTLAALKYMDQDEGPDSDKAGFLIRAIFRTISVTLGIVVELLQFHFFYGSIWSAFKSGKCFLFHFPFGADTKASAVFWIATLILTLTAMLSTLYKPIENFQLDCIKKSTALENRVVRVARTHWSSLSISNRLLHNLKNLLLGFALAMLAVFSFLVRNFLGLWGFGPCAPWVSTFIHLWFFMTNSYYVISVKLLNRHLLEDSETDWGFGQILPLIVLLTLVFSAVDQIAASKEKLAAGLSASPASSASSLPLQAGSVSSAIPLQPVSTRRSASQAQTSTGGKKPKKWTL